MHANRFDSSFRGLPNQDGLTLVELMVSITVSMFIVLAATGLLLSTKSGYITQSDQVQILDTGRFAIEIIARTLRQSAYANWDAMEGPVVTTEFLGAGVSGLDAKSLKGRTAGIDSPVSKSVNGSDVLAIGYFGAGSGSNGDGTVLNCAGFGVGAANGAVATEQDRDLSVFYVAEDSTGEPELYCKYRGDNGWASQAIARGVESFQVLYGLDTDDDAMPNRFMNATAIDALDSILDPNRQDDAGRAVAKKKQSHWRKVVAVRVALLVRGAHPAGAGKTAGEYDLFGKAYADANQASDPGVRIKESRLHKDFRTRERNVFSATIQLRGLVAGSAG